MLTDLLDEYGIDYVEQGKNVGQGWLGFTCPFHNDPSHHLGYNIRGNYFSCWSCGVIKTFELLREWGIPYEEYKAISEPSYVAKQRRPSIHGKLHYPNGWVPYLLPPHKEYLQGRGFNPKMLHKTWGIGSIGLASRLAWRIFIPVFFQGHVVSWTTRSLSNKGVRYSNAKPEEEILPIKTLLMGQDLCRHAIIVCEGPFDAMAIGPGAVCTFGIQYTQSQLFKVSKYPIRIICYDSDHKAQEKARQFCDNLGVFPGKTVNVVLSGKDPAASPKKEIQELRKRFLD